MKHLTSLLLFLMLIGVRAQSVTGHYDDPRMHRWNALFEDGDYEVLLEELTKDIQSEAPHAFSANIWYDIQNRTIAHEELAGYASRLFGDKLVDLTAIKYAYLRDANQAITDKYTYEYLQANPPWDYYSYVFLLKSAAPAFRLSLIHI